MRLSIIVVSFNTKEILKECLTSVFENLPHQSEVIVVDNNSHDGSPEMVKTDFPDVILISNKDNRGFAYANNQGMEVSKGENLLLLNSDTIVLGNSLENMISFMEGHPDYSGCACKLLNADKSLQISAYKLPTIWNTFIHFTQPLRLILSKQINYYPLEKFGGDFDAEYLTGALIMISREAYNTVGGLDEKFFFYLEDVDWSKRLGSFKPLRYLSEPEIIHLGGGSASRISAWSLLQHRRSNLLYFRIHNGALGLTILRSLFFISFLLNTFFSIIQVLRGKDLNRELLKIKIDFKALFSPVGGKEPT